jgi:cell division protein FtsL
VSLALPREWFGSSIRNDGLKREKARLRPVSAAGYLMAVALPVAALLFYMLQGVQVIRTGYEIDEMRKNLQALQIQQDQLEVELASLETLNALETLAVRDLGMMQPLPGQVVTVRFVPAAATAAAAKDEDQDAGPPRGGRLLAFLRSITKAL